MTQRKGLAGNEMALLDSVCFVSVAFAAFCWGLLVSRQRENHQSPKTAHLSGMKESDRNHNERQPEIQKGVPRP